MVTLRLAEPADFVQVGRTATFAFEHDPVMRWFFPGDDYFELNPQLVAHLASRWHATGSLWCTDDVVAIAGWVPPGRPDVDVGPGPDVEHPAWRLARFEAFGSAMTAQTPPEPHWYLNMLATHPDWQRQGLGGALMAETFALADDDGFACYLETETEANVAYYRHHGFELRDEWDLVSSESAGPHMWGMLRPAR